MALTSSKATTLPKWSWWKRMNRNYNKNYFSRKLLQPSTLKLRPKRLRRMKYQQDSLLLLSLSSRGISGRSWILSKTKLSKSKTKWYRSLLILLSREIKTSKIVRKGKGDIEDIYDKLLHYINNFSKKYIYNNIFLKYINWNEI